MAALAWLGWLKLVEGEAIASRPLLLLAVLLVVIGVQFVCTGIVTEVLARTYFEAGIARTYLVRETFGSLGGLDVAGGEGKGGEGGKGPRAGRAGQA
jgi:hypothetical protein